MGRKRGRPSKAESRLKELKEELRSGNLQRRLAAIDALDEMKGREAVSLLVDTLYDESWHVRSHAAKVLGGFGQSALPNVLRALSDGVWYVRAAASIAIGELGEIKAVDSLLPLLDEENRTVRKEAREAVSKIVRKNPRLFLKEYLEKRADDLRKDFLEKLKIMDEEAYSLISPSGEEAS